VVVYDGSLPWSEVPSRSEKNGMATRTTTISATAAGTIGRRRMKSAQRGQNPLVPAPTTRGPSTARVRFCFRLSTRGPMNPSRAGRRVSAATMVNATPMAAAMASPYRNVTPRANMPSRAMHTMIPANRTARPDVLTAVTIDDSTSRPAMRPCRCRVTMNRA